MKAGSDFLSIHELTTEDVQEILALTGELKAKQKAGVEHHLLKGKTLGMIFEKSSTRTRVSFETGMYQLGGQALFLSNRDLQIGRGEPIKDTARVLSRYLDGIMIRTYGHEIVTELAKWADIPIINGLTDLLHPCQALTDVFTSQEYKGKDLKGLTMTFIGDGNNMAHSLMFACTKLGINFHWAGPKGYEMDSHIIELAKEDAKATGSQIKLLHDPMEAAVICTDVYASMGQEEEQAKRLKDFAGFQVNQELLSVADKRVVVMHCLPAHRGEEVIEDVFEAQANVIFDEAENRLHTQKAIMALCMGGVK